MSDKVNIIYQCFCFFNILIVKKQSQELTGVNPDRNIFSINEELTSTFFNLQRFGPSTSPNFEYVFFSRSSKIIWGGVILKNIHPDETEIEHGRIFS